jgi:hypothetical protein
VLEIQDSNAEIGKSSKQETNWLQKNLNERCDTLVDS